MNRAACDNSVEASALSIAIGTIADYHALARFHYRAAAPATHVRVLRMMHEREPSPIGVLIVSMPTLDGAWRHLAWPGRYAARDGHRAAAIRRLNRELRTISRVVIDPRWRGRGLATRLVRAYLRCPLTPATEAITAMGLWCPFFARAGMTAYPLPPRDADVRLSDVLAVAHLAPIDLLDARVARRSAIAGALTRWSSASKTTRGLRGLALRQAAATALLARPVAYAHISHAARGRHTPPPPHAQDPPPNHVNPPFHKPAARHACHGDSP